MLRSKRQFYEAMLQRDAKLSKLSNRWVYTLLAATLTPVLLLFILDVPASLPPRSAGWAYIGYMLLVLILYITITRKQQQELNRTCGMKCENCGTDFEGSELVQLGFLEKCGKCGTVPFVDNNHDPM